MAKFLVAVVHPSDAERLNLALVEAGHGATRIATTGGFLGGPSSTFFMAIEDAEVAGVLAIFEQTCRDRDVEIPLVLHERLRDLPSLVRYSGAHVFIMDLERHIAL